MKKLALQRETIRRLDHLDLGAIRGGQGSVINTTINAPTRFCPVPTVNGCTGGPCVETILTPSTSVINPSGG
jgi:hypothetical protein